MKFRLIATAALALVASSAAAQPPPGPGPGMHGFGLLEFDANADGKLTKAEFDAGQRSRFDKIDANKDGSITREERQASRKAEGEIRRTEVNKVRFAELDKDKNGQLSQSEFSEAGPGPDDKGPGPHMGRPGKDGPGGPKRIGAVADKDANISFADFSARGAEAFTRADANKDGTVTVAELQALRGDRP